jgi:hypothetical protein
MNEKNRPFYLNLCPFYSELLNMNEGMPMIVMMLGFNGGRQEITISKLPDGNKFRVDVKCDDANSRERIRGNLCRGRRLKFFTGRLSTIMAQIY